MAAPIVKIALFGVIGLGGFLLYKKLATYFPAKIPGRMAIVTPEQIKYLNSTFLSMKKQVEAGTITKLDYDIKRAEMFILYGNPNDNIVTSRFIPTVSSKTTPVLGGSDLMVMSNQLTEIYDKLTTGQISQADYWTKLMVIISTYDSIAGLSRTAGATLQTGDIKYTVDTNGRVTGILPSDLEVRADQARNSGKNIDTLLAEGWDLRQLYDQRVITFDQYNRRAHPEDYDTSGESKYIYKESPRDIAFSDMINSIFGSR